MKSFTHVLGDVHGRFIDLQKISEFHPEASILQVGDMGIGFGRGDKVPPNVSFIRGNHDNPELCYQHNNFLKDFGMVNDEIFVVGGGFSIDRHCRVPMVNWWPNEELGYRQMEEATAEYLDARPQVVVSHEAPASLQEILCSHVGSAGKAMPSNTARFLQHLFTLRPPDRWYFGHWHSPYSLEIGNTTFRGLGELELVGLRPTPQEM